MVREEREVRKIKRKFKEYISKSRALRVPEEKIYDNIKKGGWDDEFIKELMDNSQSIPKPTHLFTNLLKKEDPPKINAPLTIGRKEGSLTDKVDELNEKIDLIVGARAKDEKKLNFKIPFSVKSKLKTIAKKSKVQVMLLQNNRNIKTTIGEIKEGMLIVGDKIHNGSSDFIWLWNGKIPTVLVPEWDLEPIMPSKLHQDAVENNRLIDPQTIMIRSIEYKESLMSGGKMSGKMIIWIILGIAAVIGIMFMGGK